MGRGSDWKNEVDSTPTKIGDQLGCVVAGAESVDGPRGGAPQAALSNSDASENPSTHDRTRFNTATFWYGLDRASPYIEFSIFLIRSLPASPRPKIYSKQGRGDTELRRKIGEILTPECLAKREPRNRFPGLAR